MAFSPSAIQAVLDLIEDHHLAFIAEILGEDLLSDAEIERLRAKGLLKEKATNLIRQAYEFGVLSNRLPANAADTLKVGEFLRMIGATMPELSFEEKEAIKHAKSSVATYIRGLGNTYSKKAQAILIDGDKRLRRERILQVRREVSTGLAERRTVKEVAQRLKDLTGEQDRDWLRIAATEINNAVQEGKMNAILRTVPKGTDPLVFKRVAPDCCAYCRILYTEKGKPKLFRMSELIANGSNIGRKAGRPTKGHIGLKACVDSTHPWCRCQLTLLPEGFGFDAAGQMTYVGKVKLAS